MKEEGKQKRKKKNCEGFSGELGTELGMKWKAMGEIPWLSTCKRMKKKKKKLQLE